MVHTHPSLLQLILVQLQLAHFWLQFVHVGLQLGV
jgi:hypothetical protein